LLPRHIGDVPAVDRLFVEPGHLFAPFSRPLAWLLFSGVPLFWFLDQQVLGGSQ
jgi:hypothetical protein